MEQSVKKCKICYSILDLPTGKERFFKCKFCGCPNYFEDTSSPLEEKIESLYRDIRNAEFEKAGEDVIALIKEYPDEAELYFIKVLIDGKIIYVDDGEKKIPTYTNINFDIDNKIAYKKAIELAKDDEQRSFFERQFKIIQEDHDAIRQIVESKDPKYEYDVFISFKSSEIENPNKKTVDSELADKIYKILLKNHHDLKVFYAPECLKAGENWERQIFNALYRSKCMIVIGSNRDNLNAPWVKNEWNRYLEMINSSKKAPNSLIPVVVEGDFYDVLPAKLRPLQGLKADISLSEKLSDLILDIFSKSKKNEPKKLEVKEFEAFSGAKINRETHKYDQHIDLDAIERMARTDPSVALNKLKSYDQNDPRVKEVKLLIQFGDYMDPNFYNQDLEKIGFYEQITEIISEDNINKFAQTFGKVLSSNVDTLKKLDNALFIIAYYDYLNDKTKTDILNSVVNLFSEIITRKDLINIGDDSDKKFKKLVDTILSLKDVEANVKQIMLKTYCDFIYDRCKKVTKLSKEGVDRISYYLDYVDNSISSSFVSKYYDLASVKLHETNWIALSNDDITARTEIYAKLIHLYAIKDINSGKTIFELLNKCIEETPIEKVHTLVSLNTLQMINAYREIMLNKSDDLSSIDYYYNTIFDLVATHFPEAHVKGTLDCVKNIKDELLNMRSFINSLVPTDIMTNNKIAKVNDIRGCQEYKNLDKYDALLGKKLRDDVEKFIKYVQDAEIIKDYKKPIDERINLYKANYKIFRNKSMSDTLLDTLVSNDKLLDANGLITVIRKNEKEEDAQFVNVYEDRIKGINKKRETKARISKDSAVFFNILYGTGLIALLFATAFQIYHLQEFDVSKIITTSFIMMGSFLLLTLLNYLPIRLHEVTKSLGNLFRYVVVVYSWFMIIVMITRRGIETDELIKVGIDFGSAFIPHIIIGATYVVSQIVQAILSINVTDVEAELIEVEAIANIERILRLLTLPLVFLPLFIMCFDQNWGTTGSLFYNMYGDENLNSLIYYAPNTLDFSYPYFGRTFFTFLVVIIVLIVLTNFRDLANNDADNLSWIVPIVVTMVVTYTVALFGIGFIHTEHSEVIFETMMADGIFLETGITAAVIPLAIVVIGGTYGSYALADN